MEQGRGDQLGAGGIKLVLGVDLLVADPSKAVKDLEWQPKIGFEELIHLMVDEDLKRLALEID